LQPKLILAVLCVGAAGAHASGDDAAAQDDAPSRLAIAARIDHIGRIFVPVTINGQEPFRFIVDTGAGRSTIAPTLVQKLNLEPAVIWPCAMR